MKGNEKVIEVLNGALADELTAVSQYMVHSEMCVNWGYGKLAAIVEKRAVDEMKHAEKLIGRILFLEGLPVVSQLKKMAIGATVEQQLENDNAAEAGAIQYYNDGIHGCREVGDNGSADLLQNNLEDEEAHIDWIETQLEQIKQIGLKNYLLSQVA